MKLLTPQKKVNFHGIELVVKKSTKAITADSDGSVYEHYSYPYHMGNYWDNHLRSKNYLVEVDLEGMDWKDTLVEV